MKNQTKPVAKVAKRKLPSKKVTKSKKLEEADKEILDTAMQVLKDQKGAVLVMSVEGSNARVVGTVRNITGSALLKFVVNVLENNGISRELAGMAILGITK